jgi:hypothetical protein
MDLKILQDIPSWEWPRGIGHEFLMVLRNPQAAAADRLLAAEFAGDLVVLDGFLAQTLLAIVSNPAEPDKLRAKAAVSLGPVLEQADLDEFDDPDAVPISENTFRKIALTLRKVYLDVTVPKLVRRRILEAAVRSPAAWHAEAILTAYGCDDPEWKLTAVFCMRYVQGFDRQILEALESADPKIHYEAVCAAGEWELEAAWPHLAALVTAADTGKDLLLAAIQAVSSVRPSETAELLAHLADSGDKDIAEAAAEAISMAEGPWSGEFEDEFEDEDDESGYGRRETIH